LVKPAAVKIARILCTEFRRSPMILKISFSRGYTLKVFYLEKK